MELKEKLDTLPASKTMKFIELFFLEYNVVCKLDIKPTRAKYSQKDYVKLLNKKLSDNQLKKELSKMVKFTQWNVIMPLLEMGSEVQKSFQYMGGR